MCASYLDFTSLGNFTAIRSVRVLRPLRTITKIRQMRVSSTVGNGARNLQGMGWVRCRASAGQWPRGICAACYKRDAGGVVSRGGENMFYVPECRRAHAGAVWRWGCTGRALAAASGATATAGAAASGAASGAIAGRHAVQQEGMSSSSSMKTGPSRKVGRGSTACTEQLCIRGA